LVSFGAIVAELFGLVMDLQLWPWLLSRDTQLSYVAGDSVINNLHRFIVFHLATSMSWNLPRAVVTALLILLAGRAILGSLRRAQTKITLPAIAPVGL
jgi:energy-coupling factor transport system substrate-specific component